MAGCLTADVAVVVRFRSVPSHDGYRRSSALRHFITLYPELDVFYIRMRLCDWLIYHAITMLASRYTSGVARWHFSLPLTYCSVKSNGRKCSYDRLQQCHPDCLFMGGVSAEAFDRGLEQTNVGQLTVNHQQRERHCCRSARITTWLQFFHHPV